MKKIKQLLCIALGALLLTGCKKDKDNEPARLSVEPAPGEISFGAADTQTYTYRVTTNQPQWSVQSDREWCIVTPDYKGGTFTVSALENLSDTAPEAATITVSAGRAAPLTITATQQANPIVDDYDVYLAGYYDPLDGNEMPCRWKNGVMEQLPLPAGTFSGRFTSITAANGSVYICGTLDGLAAYYWKDNEYVSLPGYYSTRSICVDNGSVYVLGADCYWKDATNIPLEASGFEGDAITLCDGDVYIGGRFTAGSHSAAYWTGGKAEPLEVFSDEWPSSTGSAAASDGKVYFGGNCYDDKGMSYPCYWIDGTITTLELPQESRGGHVWSICVENSTVYATGYYIMEDVHFPCYWVDGKLKKLDLPVYWVDCISTGIAVADGAVYVGGWYDFEDEERNDYYRVCYWKDGKRFDSEAMMGLNYLQVSGIALLKK